MCYQTSKTKLTERQVTELASRYGITPWTKAGGERYYLGLAALKDLIGLDQGFYKSGNVSSCSYVDEAGDEVCVANCHAYGKGWGAAKTFVQDGIVHTSWTPYDADIADLVAKRAEEMLSAI